MGGGQGAEQGGGHAPCLPVWQSSLLSCMALRSVCLGTSGEPASVRCVGHVDTMLTTDRGTRLVEPQAMACGRLLHARCQRPARAHDNALTDLTELQAFGTIEDKDALCT